MTSLSKIDRSKALKDKLIANGHTAKNSKLLKKVIAVSKRKAKTKSVDFLGFTADTQARIEKMLLSYGATEIEITKNTVSFVYQEISVNYWLTFCCDGQFKYELTIFSISDCEILSKALSKALGAYVVGSVEYSWYSIEEELQNFLDPCHFESEIVDLLEFARQQSEDEEYSYEDEEYSYEDEDEDDDEE